MVARGLVVALVAGGAGFGAGWAAHLWLSKAVKRRPDARVGSSPPSAAGRDGHPPSAAGRDGHPPSAAGRDGQANGSLDSPTVRPGRRTSALNVLDMAKFPDLYSEAHANASVGSPVRVESRRWTCEDNMECSVESMRITGEEASRILDAKISEDISPSENAVILLQELLLNPHLSQEERVAVIYTIQVLQSDSDGTGVPFALQTEYEDELGHDVNDWLLQDFSALSTRKEKKTRSAITMKALTKGVIFALRMQNAMRKERGQHLQNRPYYDLVPYEVNDDEAAKIMAAMTGIDEWGWDVRGLVEATNNRPLQTIGWFVLHKRGTNYAEQFSLDPAVLAKWLILVEAGYQKNPYHNSSHAADVLQSVYFFLTKGGASAYLSEIESMALLLAAIVHDMGHDGMNNVFHKNALTQRALDHNDQSIQENFHASELFNLMAQDDSVNLFKHLSKQHFAQIRSILIHCLLHTDMSKHFQNLKEFKGLIEVKSNNPAEWMEFTDQIMATLLHTADIGAQAKPLEVAKFWAWRCMEEFWLQGDREKELGLPISPQCNRENANVPAAQVGFIKFIVMPSFEVLSELLPVLQDTAVQTLAATLEYWHKEDSLIQAAQYSPLCTPSRVRRQSIIHKNVLKRVSVSPVPPPPPARPQGAPPASSQTGHL